jgi:DNA polymerase-3 subunit delta'
MSDAFSRIIGHARAVARLRAMLAHGEAPHALVIAGPRRAGKAALASAFASALLRTDAPARHPDYRLVERPRDPKTGKLKKNIPVDEIRETLDRLRMSAFLGGAKVAVVDGADALSEEAANALLRSLEEPSARAHVVLCAEDASRLPKTILSRAARLDLRRVPDAELAAALEERGADAATALRAAARADGLPGAALALLEENGMVDWYESEERRWNALRSAPLHRRFALLADLAPPRADREETVLKIHEALGVWQALLRKELRASGPDAASGLRRLLALKAALGANVQPRLLLERFVITLDR